MFFRDARMLLEGIKRDRRDTIRLVVLSGVLYSSSSRRTRSPLTSILPALYKSPKFMSGLLKRASNVRRSFTRIVGGMDSGAWDDSEPGSRPKRIGAGALFWIAFRRCRSSQKWGIATPS